MTELESGILVGGEVGGVTVTLRLFGEDLDPDRLTRELGVEPTRSYRSGDAVSARSNARRTQGMWQLKSLLPEDRPIEDHITGLLEMLPAELGVWEQATRDLRKDLFCGVLITSQVSGLSVGLTAIEQLAARGLCLELDLIVRNAPDEDDNGRI
jgi:hypothetical protein